METKGSSKIVGWVMSVSGQRGGQGPEELPRHSFCPQLQGNPSVDEGVLHWLRLGEFLQDDTQFIRSGVDTCSVPEGVQ